VRRRTTATSLEEAAYRIWEENSIAVTQHFSSMIKQTPFFANKDRNIRV
jgi:hypothetical protein